MPSSARSQVAQLNEEEGHADDKESSPMRAEPLKVEQSELPPAYESPLLHEKRDSQKNSSTMTPKRKAANTPTARGSPDGEKLRVREEKENVSTLSSKTRPSSETWRRGAPPSDHRKSERHSSERQPAPNSMYSPSYVQHRDAHRRTLDHRDMMPRDRRHPDSRQADDAPYRHEPEEYQPDPLFLPLGSFAEDSPPRARSPLRSHDKDAKDRHSRSQEQRHSPRCSPARSHYGYSSHYHPSSTYRKSPKGGHAYHHPMYYSGGAATSQQRGQSYSHPRSPSYSRRGHSPHYAYPPSGSGYPRYYPPYPPPGDQKWSSPQAYETAETGASFNSQVPQSDRYSGATTELPDRSQTSPRASPRPTSPRHSPLSDDVDTPEKISKIRSAFRSPPFSAGKSYKVPRLQSSPSNIGTYGSFGLMDTPSGHLGADFSPMGPSFNGFEENVPHSVANELTLSRSNSAEMGEPLRPSSRVSHHTHSPFNGLIGEFSPLGSATGGLQGVPRSPLRSDRRDRHSSGPEPRLERPSMPPHPPTSLGHKSGHKQHKTPHILASPLGTTSGAKPRKLWHGPDSSAGPVRLELGHSSSTQKSLEGINSMMRGQSNPMSTPSNRYRPPQPLHGYRADLSTPIKLGPSPVPTRYPIPGYSASKLPHGYPSAIKSVQSEPKLPPSVGKENNLTSQRRHPCNCKKSKCLKLYCECFAAELYCDGCNCTDCKNTAAFDQERDKAIKDTRAKNPNAFKPRISVKQGVVPSLSPPQSGHNMGCRCKRSECLKKYCECFQAGVICGAKCKCVDCANYAGSQKLIDKRRKIKDQRGADFAMRVAEQAWKGPSTARKTSVPPAARGMRGPLQSPVATSGGHPPIALPPIMHPSPSAHPHAAPPHHHYMRPPTVMGGPMPMGYSPMGLPHVSPSYSDLRAPKDSHQRAASYPRHHPGHPQPPPRKDQPAPPKPTTIPATPRTPAVRVTFDPASSRRKRKRGEEPEPTHSYFGSSLPEQPKTTALAIFSFLSNDDIYSASLVCKDWAKLATDGELWKFQA